MATVDKFEDLEVWRQARQLTVQIYALARHGDFAKDYGFRDQICRAAVSIVSNVAEGFERRSNSQFLQFLDIAAGSAGELRAQLYIALDLGYVTQAQFQDAFSAAVSISKMLASLIRHLRASPNRPQKPPTPPSPH
jgi:four helix bundle protein